MNDVIEDNKLIAAFMGLRLNTKIFNGDAWLDGKNVLHELKYDTSFDWIIPVVEKIENLGFSFITKNEGSYIEKWHYKAKIIPHFSNIGETKMDGIYSVVIQFIKWYNNTK